MSQEALDLAVRALTAAMRRPKPDFELMNKLFSPDHEFASAGSKAPGEGIAKGGEGYRAWTQEVREVMDYETDLMGAVDVAENKVLAVLAIRFRGAVSGAPLQGRHWALLTVGGGSVVRTEVFANPADALEAAGLSE